MKNSSIAARAILACLLWATAFAGVKTGLRYFPPFIFAGIRFTAAGILLLPFLKPSYYVRNIRENWKGMLSVAFFQTFLLYGCFFLGMNRVSAAVGAVIVGAGPVFTALIARIFLEEKLSLYKTAALLMGLLGVAVIAFSRNTMEGETRLAGVGILMLGSIASAAGNVIVKKSRKADPYVMNSFQMTAGGAALMAAGLMAGEKVPVNIPYSILAVILWLSFISAAAFSIWFRLIKMAEVEISYLNMWKFIIPVFGSIFSWILIAGEHPSGETVMGMLLVGAAIFIKEKQED